MTSPLEVYWCDAVLIEACKFTDFGYYHGPYVSEYPTSGIVMISTQNVDVIDSSFSSYNVDGLMRFEHADNVTLNGNTFDIESDDLLYGIDASDVGFDLDFAAAFFKNCHDVYVTNNEFKSNEVDGTTPWIYFEDGDDITCLSGNRYNICTVYTSTEMLTNIKIFYQTLWTLLAFSKQTWQKSFTNVEDFFTTCA